MHPSALNTFVSSGMERTAVFDSCVAQASRLCRVNTDHRQMPPRGTAHPGLHRGRTRLCTACVRN